MRQFDWVCHLSTFQKGKKLSLPFKGHRRLNHWLDLLSDETVYAQGQSGLLQSVELREDCLILYVQGTFQQGALIPHYKGDSRSQLESACDYVKDHQIPAQSIYGLDIGINKLACLVNSSDPTELIDPELEALLGKRPTNIKDEPNQVGESSAMMGVWQQMMLDKRLRKKKGSKSFKRATKEYHDLINHAINQLLGYLLKDKKEPLKVLVIERIKWIKFKKSSQKLLLWLCSWCFERLTHWCQVNRVVLVKVSPRYTSQQCAFCRVVTKSNRRGEWYQSQCCVNCHVDADMNGAYNIRDRFIQALKQCSLYQEPVKPAPHLKRKRSVSLPKI